MPTKKALNSWLNNKAESKNIYGSVYSVTGGLSLDNDQKFNQGITSGDKYGLMPAIAQGTSVQSRVGNQIQPLSLKVKLCMSLVIPTREVASYGGGDAYASKNSAPEDITVHVYFLKCKKYPDYNDGALIDVTKLLTPMPNNNYQVAFDGSYWNSKFRVNSEQFTTIKHLKIRLKKAAGYESYVGNVTRTNDFEPSNQLQDTSEPGRHYYETTVDIPCPKMLEYKENTAQQPVNFNPFMVAGWVCNDYPFTTNPPYDMYPLAITAKTFFRYKDI